MIGSLSRRLSVAAVICLTAGATPVSAGSAKACRQKGLERLRVASPDGYSIYRRVKVKEPAFFGTWIQCDDAQFFLPTAVHESTHLLTSQTDAFPLIGGGEIGRPHEVSAFFPPARIAEAFRSDDLVNTYLRRGKASSAEDFLFLLDEFNAYMHDLNVAVDLKDMKVPGESVDHRDGLSAMMAFLTVYAETAKATEPETWRGLRSPRVADTISRLWSRAEKVLAASCGIPNFGTSDTYYIQKFCAAGPHAAIGEILDRAPICPSACLATSPNEAETQAAVTDAPAPILFGR